MTGLFFDQIAMIITKNIKTPMDNYKVMKTICPELVMNMDNNDRETMVDLLIKCTDGTEQINWNRYSYIDKVFKPDHPYIKFKRYGEHFFMKINEIKYIHRHQRFHDSKETIPIGIAETFAMIGPIIGKDSIEFKSYVSFDDYYHESTGIWLIKESVFYSKLQEVLENCGLNICLNNPVTKLL